MPRPPRAAIGATALAVAVLLATVVPATALAPASTHEAALERPTTASATDARTPAVDSNGPTHATMPSRPSRASGPPNATLEGWTAHVAAAERANGSELRQFRDPSDGLGHEDEPPLVVEPDEALVLYVQSPGLDDRIDAQDGSFDARTLRALDDPGPLQFSGWETNLQTPALRPWLNASNVDAHRGAEPDAVYLVVYPGDVSYRHSADGFVPNSSESRNADASVYGPEYAPGDALSQATIDAQPGPTASISLPSATPGNVSVAFQAPSIPGSPRNASTSIAAWRVPHYVDAANASARDLARHYEATPQSTTITPDDRLAVAVTVNDLDDAVATQDGTLTERVLAGLNATGTFVVRQTPETLSPERWPASLWLNASNVRAIDAPGADRYVLVVDQTATVAGRVDIPATDREYAAEPGEYGTEGLYEDDLEDAAFTASYRNQSSDSTTPAATTTRSIGFRPATATVDADAVLEPASNVTVRGGTNLAPGTELAVTATTDDGTTTTATAVVPTYDTWRASFDVASVDTPTNVTFTVRRATAEPDAEPIGTATRPIETPSATVEFSDQQTATGYVHARATLSHGGVLVLRNDTAVLACSDDLAPGRTHDVTFDLDTDRGNETLTVVAYRVDADGDRDGVYENGTGTARVGFVDEPTTEPPTTTSPPATTNAPATTTLTGAVPTTTYPEPGESSVTTEFSGGDDGWAIPGLGVANALLALVALLAVAVARQRRDA